MLLLNSAAVKTKATTDNSYVHDECGCVPINLYLWKLVFEFQIIAIYHEMIFSFGFFHLFRYINKQINRLTGYKKEGSQLGLARVSHTGSTKKGGGQRCTRKTGAPMSKNGGLDESYGSRKLSANHTESHFRSKTSRNDWEKE